MKTMKTTKLIVLAIVMPFLLAMTGCPNAFLESADKHSDDALLFSAEQHANANEWTEAIADIAAMTPAGLAKRETKAALASYYAGRCGLNLLDFAQAIKDQMPATALWPLVMRAQVGATVSELNDCVQAEHVLVSIDSDAANRTADENMELVFIELAKMGAALAQSNADADHDGVVDGAFDACSSSDLSDAAAQELGSGLILTVKSLEASGSSFASGVTDTVDNMCTAIEAMPGFAGFCSHTEASDYTGTLLQGVRSLIKSNEVGFNSCGGSVGSSGACTCP
jgi:hypothetical protein